VGIPVRERPQQYRIHDAEDCGVRADAQGERQRGDEGAAWILQQHSQTETYILKQLVLQSLWLQHQRIPERARAAPQQFKIVSPIETVPFCEQPFSVTQFRFPLLPPVTA